MSGKSFRVNLHSIVAWMSRNSLLKTGAISHWLDWLNGLVSFDELGGWYKYGINQDQKNLFHKGLVDIVKGWSTNIYLKTLNFSHVFWRIILEKCLIKASDFT